METSAVLRYSTDSNTDSTSSIHSPHWSLLSSSSADVACAVRADSPLLGFELDSADPLHYPSPDYARELSLEHEYPDACDKHPRGLDPVHELDFDQDNDETDDEHLNNSNNNNSPHPPAHRPVQSRSRSHSAASSTYLSFPPPPSRRASRLPSFSSTFDLDSPQPLPPAVIPALRERVSSRSLHNKTSALSLRRTTTDSTLSLLSPSHPVSLAGIGTPDSVRNAVYFDSDHLDSLLLAAASPAPTPTSPQLAHSPQVQVYAGRPSSTGSQVYLGPSSTPTSPRQRAFPSRSSDGSSGACIETEPETPGTSPASASFDCTAASPEPAHAHARLSWEDDTELAHPRVYIHPDPDPAHGDEYDDEAEFGYGCDQDGEHTYTYGQRAGAGGLAPPQCSRWSLGSSVDAAVVALDKKHKKDKPQYSGQKRDSWGARRRDGAEKTHRKTSSGEKKMGRRKRLVSFISSRFSAAPAAASVPTLALASPPPPAPAHLKQLPRLDVEKDLPSPLFDKALPPITRSSPSPPPPQTTTTRPTLALTIPPTTTASFPSTAQTTPTTATSGSGLFTPSSASASDAYSDTYSRPTSPFVAAPGPEDDAPMPRPLLTVTTAPESEAVDTHTGLLSPTSIKTFVPAPAPLPAPASTSAPTAAPTSPSPVFTPPPPPTSPPPVAYGAFTYSIVDPPSPGLDPFRASVASPAPAPTSSPGAPAGDALFSAQPRVEGTSQLEVQKKRSRRSLGIRGLAVRMGFASSSSPSPTSPTSTSTSTSPPPLPSPPFPSDSTYSYPPPLPLPENAASSPSPTKPRRRGPKRKLVISGIEEGGYEAVREWCEGFGEVKEIRRASPAAAAGEGKGSMVVDFRKASVAETVCKLQAQVYIRGAGSVSLSWCTKGKGAGGRRGV